MQSQVRRARHTEIAVFALCACVIQWRTRFTYLFVGLKGVRSENRPQICSLLA